MSESVAAVPVQSELEGFGGGQVIEALPEQCRFLPEFRYMGSKCRLLPWIHSIFRTIDFESAWDPFCGASSVGYLLKAMGKRVVSSDFLNFSTTIARALVENPGKTMDASFVDSLLEEGSPPEHFIEQTFTGVFFTPEDLRFLDRTACRILEIPDRQLGAMAMAALVRSCLKKQPRGVFTISGDLSKYDDGRRDLRLSIREHFLEQVGVFNKASFTNERDNLAVSGDVFETDPDGVDLVYLDPPYVPRSDDNCYVKRYHFLEGLSCYWRGLEVMESTKVRKIPKRYTPFSYRKSAIEAFERLFDRIGPRKIVLSYSSNAYPDLDTLVAMLERRKPKVDVHSTRHRYHFGNHSKVKRANTLEYLIVAQ